MLKNIMIDELNQKIKSLQNPQADCPREEKISLALTQIEQLKAKVRDQQKEFDKKILEMYDINQSLKENTESTVAARTKQLTEQNC